MEGFPQKMPNEMHSFGFGTTAQHYRPAVPSGSQTAMETIPQQSYIAQGHPSNTQVDNTNTGIIPTPGTSLQENFGEVMIPQTGGGGGKKKKKKHKSGDSAVKPELMDEEGLIEAAIPLLADNPGVEDLLFNASLQPQGGTIIGGQYLLNNSLLDQILTEKKLQLMQSPEVMEWLQKNMKKP